MPAASQFIERPRVVTPQRIFTIAIQPAFELLLGVVDEVPPVELESAERAKEIVLASPRLSARDALHAATMERHEVTRILTFDRGFDEIPGVARISS